MSEGRQNVFIHGRHFSVSDTHQSFWHDVERGRWEPYTFEILEKYVPQHDNYLDVGAWIGPTVLYASRLCGKCFAIEPDPVAFKSLCKNVDMAGAKVALYNEALLDYRGNALLGSEELGNSMTRLSAAHPGRQVIEVPCQTIENFVVEHQITGSLFIKMDVEGAEEKILRSFEFFARRKPTLYLSLHPAWLVDPLDTLAAINRVGELYRNQVRPVDNVFLFTDLSK